MKAKLYLLFVIGVCPFSNCVFGQKNANNWGIALTINSIQAQVEVPMLTGPGALLLDADGNILTGGKRNDKSYSFSVIPKYRLNDEVRLRFEFGVTNLDLRAHSDQKLAFNHSISNRQVKTMIYRCAPGFQWTFMKTKTLESYCGVILSYISYGNIIDDYSFEQRDLATDTILYWIKLKETTPGGFAFGVGALAGFNIYIKKHVSVGAELSSSALYYNIGGETKGESLEQAFPGPVYGYATTFENSYSGFKVSKIISSFNISFWF